MIYPRLFGNPSKQESHLYLGWKVNDRYFPYVLSIYPSITILILALVGIARWPIPHRWAWALMAGLGVFLALGKYNPVYANFLIHLPPFSVIRYPEKFILLTTSALAFAGPLAWQHLLKKRRKGHPEIADFPLALSLVSSGIAGILLGVARYWPQLPDWFVRTNSGVHLTPDQISVGVEHLNREMVITLGFAIALTLLLLLHRIRKFDHRTLSLSVVLLVAFDLAYFGKDLVETGPARDLLSTPLLAASMGSDQFRIASFKRFDGTPQFVLPRQGGLPPILREGLDRLDPYTGNIWGISYFGNIDYDLMLTDWAQHSHRIFDQIRGDDLLSQLYLGVWNVKFSITPRSFKQQIRDRNRGDQNPAAGVVTENPHFLARYRFTPQVVFRSDVEKALAGVQTNAFVVQTQDYWIDESLPERGERLAISAADTRLLDLRESSARVEARYSSSGPTYFVAAITFDEKWRASVDGLTIKTFPTGLGQIGVELPPGEHHLRLSYSDLTVVWGALLSLLAVIAALIMILRAKTPSDGRVLP
jgi:hypothetical protein